MKTLNDSLNKHKVLATEKRAPSSYSLIESAVKRLMDITISTVLLIALTPLLLLIAIVIKLDSPGPIFYGGIHVCKNNRLFKMWKFRTMHKDTPGDLSNKDHLGKVAQLNDGGDKLVKIKNDPRVTRFGKFLRRASANELPQLYNVLIGEMSLVGPRPQAPYEVAEYTKKQKKRLLARPGISGLWQVTSRSSPSFEEFIRLDLEYIEKWSLWLDLKILFKTIPAVIKGTGPYY